MPRAEYEPQSEPRYHAAPPSSVLAPPPPRYHETDDPLLDEPRRPSLLRRLGPVGIAAIVAAVLFTFGAAAAVVAVFGGSPPVAQTATDQPTPVEPAIEPVPPPDAFSASPAPSRSAKPSASTAGRVTGDPRQEAAVVALVNQERGRSGCRQPLRTDDKLRTAARAHSVDMAIRGFFSHTGSDGSTPEQRMREAGFNQPVAENLARGQGGARDVVRAWMASPEHRRNILNCDSRHAGVGLAVRNGDDPFWTLDFGR